MCGSRSSRCATVIMRQTKATIITALVALIAMTFGVTSCNEKSDSYLYESPINLAVTNFKLKYDVDNEGLDSVFFSIDLKNGVIFNADSLPKGTKIDKLVATISYSGAVEAATIKMEGGETAEGEIDYMKHPTDTIDFTGKVTLTLSALDGEISNSYRIKVNVHNEVPDTIVWDQNPFSYIPSRNQKPVSAKTVMVNGLPTILVGERDGSYSLVRYTSMTTPPQFTIEEVTLPQTAIPETLSSLNDELYILCGNGTLMKMVNAKAWEICATRWESLIGSYNDSLLGVKNNGGVLCFTQFPLRDMNESVVPEDFPMSQGSDFITLSNKWTNTPVGFFIGGKDQAGNLSDSTWAFDGTEWVRLSQGGFPAIQGATLLHYYNYRPSASSDAMIEYEVWMILGGKLADGSFNRTVYVSYDNGVNWAKGTAGLQLPDFMPALVNAAGMVISTEYSANLSDAWKKSSLMKIPHVVDGDIITWECPYIYLIGGYDAENKLYDVIRKGVLNRMTFTPIF